MLVTEHSINLHNSTTSYFYNNITTIDLMSPKEMILEGFLGLKNHHADFTFVKEFSREMFVLHMV